MKIFETERDPMPEIIAALTAEAVGPDPELERAVRKIIADVKKRGDQAVLEIGKKYDHPDLDSIEVSNGEFEEAYSSVQPSLLDAIRTAKSNIETFHRKQLPDSWMDVQDDFIYGQMVRPIEKVGIHIPGASAPLASSVLMTAVPAAVAGVSEIVICTPVQKATGKVAAASLVAARECGVARVFKAGGAAAVAAMAFGTDSVPRVDKIVGPGSPYSQEAKRQLFGIVGVDQVAGPSEILVLADDSSDPAFLAADIVSQAEHAEDSRCALLTTSRTLADAVLREIRNQTETAERKEIIKESLGKFGLTVIARDLAECAELANIYAPEHLEIAVAQPWEVLRGIKNAGAIMLGQYTPVPLCDFVAGPNHTLPTGGTARFSSQLGVDDFIKKSGLLSYTKTALEKTAQTVYEMAEAEGLPAHANALRVRTER